ncbi:MULTISPECIES: PTS sugar transporter subunit IIB [Bacillus]|uniref:PTS sugar transporter subunit IIB n=1 Tax=Bacillus TaxID=1386 RepID=UPI0002DDD702|nr:MULTISPECIES: PTS sugar transporter subunit IIB [Bacillus]
MKIICVCGLGQGTSLILRMNVEAILSELGISADVEHMDVSSASGMEADYIVTNSELAATLEGHKASIILVSNYFDKNEIKESIEKTMNL